MTSAASLLSKALRWIVYVGGWALAFAAMVPLLMTASISLRSLPMPVTFLAGIIGSLLALLPVLAMAMRVARWISVGRPSIPVTFSSWTFGLTAASVGVATLAIVITLLAFLVASVGSMSGVPAGMVILGCSFFALAGIVATELADWRNSPRSLSTAPFNAAPLMDDAERVMHQRLVSVLPECLVFAKVQLPGLVSVRPGHDAFAWHDKVSRLNVDFVVCLKDSSVVVAAVDLQTDEDLSRKVMRNFERKEQALNAAGITLLSWSALNLPDESEIRAAFTQ